MYALCDWQNSRMMILDDQARQQNLMTLHFQLSLQYNVSPIMGFVRHTARDGRNVALKWQLEVKSHLLACLIIQNNHPTINSSMPNNFHANWQNDCVEKNKWRLVSLREFQNRTAEASIKGPWYGEGTNPKPDQEYGKATRLYRTMPRIQNGVYIKNMEWFWKYRTTWRKTIEQCKEYLERCNDK